ncbi:unnamed protein product [Amoebophrya sp. A120]|nr:unnamed protein product [Amoebophrya sp. A120]|eukprot:GSA120T00013557001.1
MSSAISTDSKNYGTFEVAKGESCIEEQHGKGSKKKKSKVNKATRAPVKVTRTAAPGSGQYDPAYYDPTAEGEIRLEEWDSHSSSGSEDNMNVPTYMNVASDHVATTGPFSPAAILRDKILTPLRGAAGNYASSRLWSSCPRGVELGRSSCSPTRLQLQVVGTTVLAVVLLILFGLFASFSYHQLVGSSASSHQQELTSVLAPKEPLGGHREQLLAGGAASAASDAAATGTSVTEPADVGKQEPAAGDDTSTSGGGDGEEKKIAGNKDDPVVVGHDVDESVAEHPQNSGAEAATSKQGGDHADDVAGNKESGREPPSAGADQADQSKRKEPSAGADPDPSPPHEESGETEKAEDAAQHVEKGEDSSVQHEQKAGEAAQHGESAGGRVQPQPPPSASGHMNKMKIDDPAISSTTTHGNNEQTAATAAAAATEGNEGKKPVVEDVVSGQSGGNYHAAQQDSPVPVADRHLHPDVLPGENNVGGDDDPFAWIQDDEAASSPGSKTQSTAGQQTTEKAATGRGGSRSGDRRRGKQEEEKPPLVLPEMKEGVPDEGAEGALSGEEAGDEEKTAIPQVPDSKLQAIVGNNIAGTGIPPPPPPPYRPPDNQLTRQIQEMQTEFATRVVERIRTTLKEDEEKQPNILRDNLWRRFEKKMLSEKMIGMAEEQRADQAGSEKGMKYMVRQFLPRNAGADQGDSVGKAQEATIGKIIHRSETAVFREWTTSSGGSESHEKKLVIKIFATSTRSMVLAERFDYVSRAAEEIAHHMLASHWTTEEVQKDRVKKLCTPSIHRIIIFADNVNRPHIGLVMDGIAGNGEDFLNWQFRNAVADKEAEAKSEKAVGGWPSATASAGIHGLPLKALSHLANCMGVLHEKQLAHADLRLKHIGFLNIADASQGAFVLLDWGDAQVVGADGLFTYQDRAYDDAEVTWGPEETGVFQRQGERGTVVVYAPAIQFYYEEKTSSEASGPQLRKRWTVNLPRRDIFALGYMAVESFAAQPRLEGAAALHNSATRSAKDKHESLSVMRTDDHCTDWDCRGSVKQEDSRLVLADADTLSFGYLWGTRAMKYTEAEHHHTSTSNAGTVTISTARTDPERKPRSNANAVRVYSGNVDKCRTPNFYFASLDNFGCGADIRLCDAMAPQLGGNKFAASLASQAILDAMAHRPENRPSMKEVHGVLDVVLSGVSSRRSPEWAQQAPCQCRSSTSWNTLRGAKAQFLVWNPERGPEDVDSTPLHAAARSLQTEMLALAKERAFPAPVIHIVSGDPHETTSPTKMRLPIHVLPKGFHAGGLDKETNLAAVQGTEGSAGHDVYPYNDGTDGDKVLKVFRNVEKQTRLGYSAAAVEIAHHVLAYYLTNEEENEARPGSQCTPKPHRVVIFFEDVAVSGKHLHKSKQISVGLVMERVEGDGEAFLTSQNRPKEEQGLPIKALSKLTECLWRVHSRSLAHGDLQLRSIGFLKIEDPSSAVLLDWGSAEKLGHTRLSEHNEEPLWHSGLTWGPEESGFYDGNDEDATALETSRLWWAPGVTVAEKTFTSSQAQAAASPWTKSWVSDLLTRDVFSFGFLVLNSIVADKRDAKLDVNHARRMFKYHRVFCSSIKSDTHKSCAYPLGYFWDKSLVAPEVRKAWNGFYGKYPASNHQGAREADSASPPLILTTNHKKSEFTIRNAADRAPMSKCLASPTFMTASYNHNHSLFSFSSSSSSPAHESGEASPWTIKGELCICEEFAKMLGDDNFAASLATRAIFDAMGSLTYRPSMQRLGVVFAELSKFSKQEGDILKRKTVPRRAAPLCECVFSGDLNPNDGYPGLEPRRKTGFMRSSASTPAASLPELLKSFQAYMVAGDRNAAAKELFNVDLSDSHDRGAGKANELVEMGADILKKLTAMALQILQLEEEPIALNLFPEVPDSNGSEDGDGKQTEDEDASLSDEGEEDVKGASTVLSDEETSSDEGQVGRRNPFC